MSRLTRSKSPRARTPARRIAPTPGEHGVSATCATTSRTHHSLHTEGRSQSASGRPSTIWAKARRWPAITAHLVSTSMAGLRLDREAVQCCQPLVLSSSVADPAPVNTGVLLFLPYRAMESRVFAGLAEQGYDDLTPAQARVFQRVADQGSRVTDLAEQAGITKQTAGFLVDQLERAGYVERVPDPVDGRARLVRITERGARSVAASAAI